MYVKPIGILRLDGKVVRPRRNLLLEVTEREAFIFRKRGRAIHRKLPTITEDTTIIKSKEFQNESKSKSLRDNTGFGDSGGSNIKKRQLQQAKSKSSKS